MVAHCYTVAFEGIEARLIDVQCSVVPALPSLTIVGLPDKAISESKERVRAALSALSIALPAKRITINLAPADMPKRGNHYDLPIALALLAALEVIPQQKTAAAIALGEIGLDGALLPVSGGLPAAMTALEEDKYLYAPNGAAQEAAAIAPDQAFGAAHLSELIAHLNDRETLAPAAARQTSAPTLKSQDMCDVKGQERAKRALEIAVAGRHHLLLVGPPGAGKSMLASRAPSIAPKLSPQEALETATIHSICGLVQSGEIPSERPFRAPHHSASPPSIVGGGSDAAPGEISLAHNGFLFMDEMPEYARTVLETLRQPLESGEVHIARAKAHVKYPARFLLIAAANPCKCGHAADPARACSRMPNCMEDYMGRISGPLMDRFDLRVDVPPVAFDAFDHVEPSEPSLRIAQRVQEARAMQAARYEPRADMTLNCDAQGEDILKLLSITAPAQKLLRGAADKFRLSARGYTRILRVARTIADLEQAFDVSEDHMSESLSFRLSGFAS